MGINTVKYSKLSYCSSTITLIMLSSKKELARDFSPSTPPQVLLSELSFATSKMADCTYTAPLLNFELCKTPYAVHHTDTSTRVSVP